MGAALSESLLLLLACPKDGASLDLMDARTLSCPRGHRYPVVGNVPVLLRDDREQTMGIAYQSMAAASSCIENLDEVALENCLFLESLGASEAEIELARQLAKAPQPQHVDPVVSVIVAATNGYAYKHLVGKLKEYPVPDIRLDEGEGRLLLDIGCNWGRWSISAARKGYRVVGVDPSLCAVMAAKRTARQLGLDIEFVCGDARSLSFQSEVFDVVYSYSVLQHFSKHDAREAIDQVERVLKEGGRCLIQMAHTIGVRSLYHQLRRGFREGRDFEVRYWTLPELMTAFSSKGWEALSTSVHCFFGLGLEASDLAVLPPRIGTLVRISETLRSWSEWMPFLKYVADSLFISASKTGHRNVETARCSS